MTCAIRSEVFQVGHSVGVGEGQLVLGDLGKSEAEGPVNDVMEAKDPVVHHDATLVSPQAHRRHAQIVQEEINPLIIQ